MITFLTHWMMSSLSTDSFVSIGCLPHMSSSKTTPKLYTSLLSVNLWVLKYLLNTTEKKSELRMPKKMKMWFYNKYNSFTINNIVKRVQVMYVIYSGSRYPAVPFTIVVTWEASPSTHILEKPKSPSFPFKLLSRRMFAVFTSLWIIFGVQTTCMYSNPSNRNGRDMVMH